MVNEAHFIDIDGTNEKETRSQIIIRKIQQHNKGKKAYEPTHFSVGPYHHGAPSLRATEKMKWGYLNYLLDLNHEKKLKDYIEAIKRLEKQARSCYADEIKMDKNSFVEMLLLDGCFILMAFNGIDGILPPNINMDQVDMSQQINQNEGTNEEDSNEIEQFYTKFLMRDVLLLENQIPFFAITKIYEIVTEGRSSVSLLEKNVFQSIEEALGHYPMAIQEFHRPQEIQHLLHLCHMYFKPSHTVADSCQNQVRSLPFKFYLDLRRKFIKRNEQNMYFDQEGQSLVRKQPIKWRWATQYVQARIELKKREVSSETLHSISLLDMKFSNGILEVPCFNIDQENCDLFRNLIAFEQANPQFGNYITAYIVFWSHFITATDDVSWLIERGIIEHHLHSDKEVSDLFRSLGDGIKFDFSGDYYRKCICQRMEEYYEIWKPRCREWLGSITSKIPSLYRKNKPELPLTLSQRQAKGC